MLQDAIPVKVPSIASIDKSVPLEYMSNLPRPLVKMSLPLRQQLLISDFDMHSVHFCGSSIRKNLLFLFCPTTYWIILSKTALVSTFWDYTISVSRYFAALYLLFSACNSNDKAVLLERLNILVKIFICAIPKIYY